MIFRKDNFLLGAVLGFIGPIVGLLLFKMTKFSAFSFTDTLKYLYMEIGHRHLTVGLSVSLLINALLFTIYVNGRRDKTAKGIFVLTCIYGIGILLIKTFS
ncbi:MAG: hypothetical protein QM687_13135 [Ferruginibacter sp.]